MNILFIDDHPQEKVMPVVNYLTAEHIDFSYEVIENVNDAMIYIFTHLAEIDLIITDLGLPRYKDGSDYEPLNGLDIINELIRKDISTPVIVNSTTTIPNLSEYIEVYIGKNHTFYYTDSLTGAWLKQYIEEYTG